MTYTRRYALVWGCVLLLVVAVVLHVWQVYFMSASLALLTIMSYLLGRRSLAGLHAQRRAPVRLYSGRSGRVSLDVTNTGMVRRTLFGVVDTLPPGIVAEHNQPHLLIDLPAGETLTVQYDMTPLHRGVFRLGPVQFSATDGLGMYNFSATDQLFSEMVVYPTPLPLPDLWPRYAVAPSERRRRRVLGRGDDFAGVREYVPGDDMRRISWTNTARRGKLTVVETEMRETMSATIILDLTQGVHVGEGENSSLEYAVVLAASLATQAVERGGAVGLIAVGAQDYSVPRLVRQGQELLLMEALARCQDDCLLSLDQVLRGREQMLTRAGAVAVISPQAGGDMLNSGARLTALGSKVSWFALEQLTFAPQTGRRRVPQDDRYFRLCAALTDAGVKCHRISGERPLLGNFGGWYSAAV